MKELKKKLLKIKKIKFIRNIAICFVSLIAVALIINIAPGYKRDKYKDIVNLIINEENKTEELKHDIYVNENKTVYISEDDIRNFFDENIYYDENYNQIITTSNTKVANIVINEKKMIVNNSNVEMIDGIIKIDDTIYLPISDMEIVYNINVEYIESTKRVVIDELDKGMIKAIAFEESEIKYKPRGLSKNIGVLKEGEPVYCFYTTSKGWRQIRTQYGILGYVKANKLTSEYILRQDMQKRGEASVISINDYKNKQFNITEENESKKIIIKRIFNIEEDNIEVSENYKLIANNYKSWVTISDNMIENNIDNILKEYKIRTDIINLILDKVIENKINGVVIDFTKSDERENTMRFVIELAPKLREIGVNTSIVINEKLKKDDYINIVDFIIE